MSIRKDTYFGKMRVRVFDTRDEMGVCAGTEAALKIKELLSGKEEINVMFAAAPSQNETLQVLMADPDIDWSRVNGFHMDEYVGLDENHPAGFRNFLRKAVFDRKPFKSVHLLNGNANDPEEEADRYGKLLEEHPLEICILGIGENGHIAFNDPPVADFADTKRAKVVKLDRICREQQVHDGCFEKLEDVPTHALTVTVPGLCAAKGMYCSVPAATKANAVAHVVRDEISTACPATILKAQEHAFLYADEEAGREIL